MAAILAIDAEREAPLLDREREPIGAGIAVVMRPPRREMIAFEQIVDRDPALLPDIRAAPQDGTLVELHVDDPRIGQDRKSVVEGKSGSVRVDPGGRRSI